MSSAARQKRHCPTAAGERTGSHPWANPAAPALPCPAPTRGRRGQRPVTGRGEAGQEVASGSWVKAPRQERAPCAGSGRGLREALVSRSRFGNHALPALPGAEGLEPGPERGPGDPEPGAPRPRFRSPLPGVPLPPRRRSARLGSGAGSAWFACGGAPGAGNRGSGSAGSLPGGDGPGGREQEQEQEEAAAPAGSGSAARGASPSAPGITVLGALGLPSSNAVCVPWGVPAVLTTQPAVGQSRNCVYSERNKGKNKPQKSSLSSQLSQMITSTGFQFPWWWQCNLQNIAIGKSVLKAEICKEVLAVGWHLCSHLSWNYER